MLCEGGGDVQSAIEPYEVENRRLLKEQNELHRKLIESKDTLDNTLRQHKDQVIGEGGGQTTLMFTQ